MKNIYNIKEIKAIINFCSENYYYFVPKKNHFNFLPTQFTDSHNQVVRELSSDSIIEEAFNITQNAFKSEKEFITKNKYDEIEGSMCFENEFQLTYEYFNAYITGEITSGYDYLIEVIRHIICVLKPKVTSKLLAGIAGIVWLSNLDNQWHSFPHSLIKLISDEIKEEAEKRIKERSMLPLQFLMT